MTSQTENELLTRVGSGTLMGELLRQYWMPALKTEELPASDCDPVRLMLLGERLVAYRDTSGAVGVLAEACPHRGASLFFGRNEEGGLRCAYHGWKFNVRGECLDMPCEPENSTLLRRMRTRAYPCLERGGVVWVYMGPRSVPPPLPDLVMNMGSADRSRVDLMQVECNWLQNLEGDVDTDHIGVLHGSNLDEFRAILRGNAASPTAGAHTKTRKSLRRVPVEVEESPVGCTFAYRLMPQQRGGEVREESTVLPKLWSVGQFMFPFYSMLPYGSFGPHWVAARVPMDDYHTMTFAMYSANDRMLSDELMFGSAPARLPATPDWFGRHRLSRDLSNDFGLDRATARNWHGAHGLGAGISGQAVQDAAIVSSMGPVADRTKEHLSDGDVVLLRVRNQLLSAARALAERGVVPPGVDDPAGYRMGQGVLPVRVGSTWQEEVFRAAHAVGV